MRSVSRIVSQQAGQSPGWPLIKQVCHQAGLSSSQSVTRPASHQASLSPGWPLIKPVCHQAGLSSSQSVTRLASHQARQSPGWPLIKRDSHQAGLSSSRSVLRLASQQASQSPGWPLNKPISHQGFHRPKYRRLQRRDQAGLYSAMQSHGAASAYLAVMDVKWLRRPDDRLLRACRPCRWHVKRCTRHLGRPRL